MMIRMAFRAVWSLAFLAALGVLPGCGGYGGGAAGAAGGSAGGPGGGGTGGGGGGGGAPGTGWLVAQRFEPDRLGIDVLPLDATGGTPVRSVAGAVVVGAIPGVGIAYGSGAAALGFAEVGFFREGDAQRVVLANEAGRSYAFVTDPTSATPFLASGRLMVSERTEISGVSLLSFAADGGDPRKLTNTACAGIFGARMRPGGIAYACDPEASYFSDGFATAVPLGANAALAIPLEIATVGSRPYVILETALSRLITMPADGSNTFASLSPDPSGTDVLLAMAGSTALVTTTISGTDHATYTVSADGSSRKVRNAGGAGPAVSGSPRVTPDQGHFLVIYRNDVGTQSRAFLVPADPGDDVSIGLPTPSDPASALEATQFADGTLLVKLEGVGYRTVSAAGDPGPLLESATDIHRVDAGSFAVFQSPAAPHPMKAVRLDGTETVLLTETGDDTRLPVVSPGGRIFFLDGNGRPWVAAPDLGLRTPIDGIAADALELTGGDGIREFVAVRRVTGDRATFVVHTDTGQVDSPLGGTADVVGWFLP